MKNRDSLVVGAGECPLKNQDCILVLATFRRQVFIESAALDLPEALAAFREVGKQPGTALTDDDLDKIVQCVGAEIMPLIGRLSKNKFVLFKKKPWSPEKPDLFHDPRDGTFVSAYAVLERLFVYFLNEEELLLPPEKEMDYGWLYYGDEGASRVGLQRAGDRKTGEIVDFLAWRKRKFQDLLRVRNRGIWGVLSMDLTSEKMRELLKENPVLLPPSGLHNLRPQPPLFEDAVPREDRFVFNGEALPFTK